jgi:hypothetical protein
MNMTGTTTHDVDNPYPVLGQAQICGEIKQLMESQPSFFDKWVSNGNT